MNSKNAWRVVGAVLISALLVPGCSLKKAVRQKAPEKRYFVLETNRSGSSGPESTDGVVYVRDVSISPRYDGAGFVYRRGEAEYVSDFYNRFLIPPDLVITQEIREWILSAGIFGQVIDSGSVISARYALEGRVNEFYADYTRQPAQAVLEVEFYLVEDPVDRSDVLFHKRFRQEVALDDRKPESLVRGWSTALSRTLGEFEQGLRGVEFKAADSNR